MGLKQSAEYSLIIVEAIPSKNQVLSSFQHWKTK